MGSLRTHGVDGLVKRRKLLYTFCLTAKLLAEASVYTQGLGPTGPIGRKELSDEGPSVLHHEDRATTVALD